MVCEIIKRLEANNEAEFLQKLSVDAQPIRKLNKKLHEVLEISFD